MTVRYTRVAARRFEGPRQIQTCTCRSHSFGGHWPIVHRCIEEMQQRPPILRGPGLPFLHELGVDLRLVFGIDPVGAFPIDARE
jgi:hypothetical protein